MPFKLANSWIDLVAQLVEHYTFNVRVLGSNPSGVTKKPPLVSSGGFFCCAVHWFNLLPNNPLYEKDYSNQQSDTSYYCEELACRSKNKPYYSHGSKDGS